MSEIKLLMHKKVGSDWVPVEEDDFGGGGGGGIPVLELTERPRGESSAGLDVEGITNYSILNGSYRLTGETLNGQPVYGLNGTPHAGNPTIPAFFFDGFAWIWWAENDIQYVPEPFDAENPWEVTSWIADGSFTPLEGEYYIEGAGVTEGILGQIAVVTLEEGLEYEVWVCTSEDPPQWSLSSNEGSVTTGQPYTISAKNNAIATLGSSGGTLIVTASPAGEIGNTKTLTWNSTGAFYILNSITETEVNFTFPTSATISAIANFITSSTSGYFNGTAAGNPSGTLSSPSGSTTFHDGQDDTFTYRYDEPGTLSIDSDKVYIKTANEDGTWVSVADQNGENYFRGYNTFAGNLLSSEEVAFHDNSVLSRRLASKEHLFSMNEIRPLNGMGTFNVSGGSSGAAALVDGHWSISAGTTASAWHRVSLVRSITNVPSFTGANSSTNVPVAIGIVGSLGISAAANNAEFRIIFGDAGTTVAPPAVGSNLLSARGFGAKIYWSTTNSRVEFKLVSHNGSTYTESAGVAFPIDATGLFHFILSFDGNGKIKAWGSYSVGNAILSRPYTEFPLMTHGGGPTGVSTYGLPWLSALVVNSAVAPTGQVNVRGINTILHVGRAY